MFDPFDLTDIEVRHQDRSYGAAVAFRIGRHAHPKARPEHPEPAAPAPTGIDYLRLVDTAHDATLADRVNYAALTGADTAGTGDLGQSVPGDDDTGGEDAA